MLVLVVVMARFRRRRRRRRRRLAVPTAAAAARRAHPQGSPRIHASYKRPSPTLLQPSRGRRHGSGGAAPAAGAAPDEEEHYLYGLSSLLLLPVCLVCFYRSPLLFPLRIWVVRFGPAAARTRSLRPYLSCVWLALCRWDVGGVGLWGHQGLGVI
jgi:hypothetical protein